MAGQNSVSESTMAIMTVAVLLFIGIWVVTTIISSVSLPTTTYQAALEGINFTANNTYFPLANSNQSALTLYYYQNTTFPFDTAKYSVLNNNTGSYVRIFTNGTTSTYANVTTNQNYYSSYNYVAVRTEASSAFSSAQTTVWNAITLLSVVIIMIAAIAIFAYFGFGKK